jgi:hypothetical protein
MIGCTPSKDQRRNRGQRATLTPVWLFVSTNSRIDGGFGCRLLAYSNPADALRFTFAVLLPVII